MSESSTTRVPDLARISEDLRGGIDVALASDDTQSLIVMVQLDLALAMAIDTRRTADAMEKLARAIERQSGPQGHKIVTRER